MVNIYGHKFSGTCFMAHSVYVIIELYVVMFWRTGQILCRIIVIIIIVQILTQN